MGVARKGGCDLSSFHLLQLISAPQLAPKKTESILIFHSDECEMKTLNEKLDQIASAGRERGGEESCLAGWAQLSPQLELGTEHCLGYAGLGCADEQQLILITVICAAVHNDA